MREKMNIDSLRGKIDQIDEKIISLLAERFIVVSKIGEIKKKEGRRVTDPAREIEVLSRIETHSKSHNLDPEAMKKIFHAIFEESRNFQRKKKEGL